MQPWMQPCTSDRESDGGGTPIESRELHDRVPDSMHARLSKLPDPRPALEPARACHPAGIGQGDPAQKAFDSDG